MGNGVRPNEAGAAGSILDKELLAKGFAQSFAIGPRQQIVGSAGGKWNDDPNWSRRPFGCNGRAEAKSSRCCDQSHGLDE
jgi:hypothetical protein